MRWCKQCHDAASGRTKRTLAYRFSYYRANAKQRGLEFSLTQDDFRHLWNALCGYCGDPIVGIGLDRIDNAKGYTRENAIPCCKVCNGMKSNTDLLAFVHRCHRIAERLYLGCGTPIATASINEQAPAESVAPTQESV